MRIAQIVMPDATEYERKCQRVDFAALGAQHEVAVTTPAGPAGYDVAHVYSGPTLRGRDLAGLTIPYVASVAPQRSRWPFGRTREPFFVATPSTLPEAVEDSYFATTAGEHERPRFLLGTFGPRRPGVRNLVEQTLARIHRFRDDIDWNLYESVPSPDALADVDLWVDPATSETDFDGFVAEALVVGLQVVATRTPVNSSRLEKGRTGFLVPPSDPNEMTHAILAALFKREVAMSRQQAARQTISKFRSRQRLRGLARAYETLNS